MAGTSYTIIGGEKQNNTPYNTMDSSGSEPGTLCSADLPAQVCRDYFHRKLHPQKKGDCSLCKDPYYRYFCQSRGAGEPWNQCRHLSIHCSDLERYAAQDPVLAPVYQRSGGKRCCMHCPYALQLQGRPYPLHTDSGPWQTYCENYSYDCHRDWHLGSLSL